MSQGEAIGEYAYVECLRLVKSSNTYILQVHYNSVFFFCYVLNGFHSV